MYKILSKIKNRLCRSNNIQNFFNVPIKIYNNHDYSVNEKIFELPFIYSVLNGIDTRESVLDFGCTRSWVSIALSTLGYCVNGIDLRDYIFEHPNFDFNKMSILEYKKDNFDYVICLSVLEHVGLGAYKEKPDDSALDSVIKDIYNKLKPNGKLILTTPVGKESVDEFERSFDPVKLERKLESFSFSFNQKKYFSRDKGKFWSSCLIEQIKEVDNSKGARSLYKNGTNGVACYLLTKK